MAELFSLPGVLKSERGQAVLSALPPPDEFSGRMALARFVCEELDFRDAGGQWQLSSCIAALIDLEKAGVLSLPPSGKGKGISRRPRMQSTAVPPAVSVPDRVDQLSGLVIRLVEGDQDRRLLSRLLSDEHPLGSVQHAGRQLRYLVDSAHGILGGLVFASPAPRLGARDAWIGWDDEERSAGIGRLMGLNRFLIRPLVRCANLASKVLSLCLGRLSRDAQARYGAEPVLVETFVGDGYDGISLCAAGWTYVGETAGRGRRAAVGQTVPRKGVWVRPLMDHWRESLGGVGPGREPPPRPRWILSPGEGLDMDQWARNEFGETPFGKALRRRLVHSAGIQSTAPSKTFFTAAGGVSAEVTGYYRMINKAGDEAVGFTPEGILTSHRERTVCRMRGASTVLLIEDGTDLNFATHPGCEGMGVIGRNGSGKWTLGMHLHSTFAINAEGIPLGVPRMEFACPSGKAEKNKAPEDRKSARWLRGWRDSSALASQVKGVQVISVMDREGDIAALFAEHQSLGGADLLVRARHDRVLSDGGKLFESLRGSPAAADHGVRVDRASARRSARGQTGFAGREARLAQTELRWQEICFAMPKEVRERLGTTSVSLTAVHVHEPEPPSGCEALEWLLLTTLPITEAQAARQVLDYYALRWRIEDWHRILKTGCEVEKIAHTTAPRIQAAVTINAVIAWRLATLTLMGRETPELPARTMFAESELVMLLDYARFQGWEKDCTAKTGQPWDPQTLSLGRALLLVARVGGYLNRKSDSAPGHQVVWEGYTRMVVGAKTLERVVKIGSDSAFYPYRESRTGPPKS